MKKLAVMANCSQQRAGEVLDRLGRKAGELGLELLADGATARLLPQARACDPPDLFDGVDAVLALGGDGTVLRTARTLDGRDRPILGVNMGGLGFLTSVAEKDLERAVECLGTGDVCDSRRAVAEGTVVREGTAVARYRGLNEVILMSSPSARLVTLDFAVDDDTGTSGRCDGLIVSTPTGSTGHSLSAGGPILAPDAQVFGISLICAHTLTFRPLVVPDCSVVHVHVSGERSGMVLSVDGQVGQPLEPGDSVQVRRSDRDVRFLHLPGYSYFEILRRKLRWSGLNA